MNHNQELGKWGEDRACDYLIKQGYEIVERNFKTKWGELDIISKKKNDLVFVEVKTIEKQEKEEPFFPEDEIDAKKQFQLKKMLFLYLAQKKISPETACQIDVIAIEQHSQKENDYSLRHYQNAVEDNF
ncbi:YraN family protein [Candidatus Gribaldobacteria bacterium]|nr:YraN family protein [Candidatus Gribaldobacteria bacterium]